MREEKKRESNQTRQEHSQLAGVSLCPGTKSEKALDTSADFHLLQNCSHRETSQELLLKMVWFCPTRWTLRIETRAPAQGCSFTPLTYHWMCFAAHKNGTESNTIYYQKLVPGLILTQGVYTNTAVGGITVTVWLPPAGKGSPAVPVCVHCQWQLRSPTVLSALGTALYLVLLKWHECSCLLPWRLLI